MRSQLLLSILVPALITGLALIPPNIFDAVVAWPAALKIRR
jgi:hypothetical protein